MVDFPPKLSQESPRAYEAFTTYARMGTQRSQEAVSQKLAKSRQIMSRWSSAHDWVNRAQIYDAALAREAAVEHQVAYLADLEDYRKRTEAAGRGLYTVAGKLLTQLHALLGREPLRVVGEDGQEYCIPALELKAADLLTVARALVVAMDLEAFALGLDKLLRDDQ